jgi:KDO2-lipid IV(A) lauroyltransferase
MARSKSSLQIHLEYALVWPLWQTFQRMPIAWIRTASRWILKTMLLAMPRRRKMMLSNIALCFPQLTVSEQTAMADESLDTFARGLAVFSHMPAILEKKDVPWLHYEGVEHLEKVLALGKGVIAFNAHFGCWEMSSAYVMHHHKNVAAVYRPLDNPKIDALVAHQRCFGGGFMMDRRKVIREGLPLLRNNGILGIVVDQNFAGGGVFVHFFGRLAATTPIVSIMARRTEAAVLPMHSYWENDQLILKWEAPLALSENPDATKAVEEDTQKMTTVVENWIREKPGQWFWLHNRWKRRPQPEEMAAEE